MYSMKHILYWSSFLVLALTIQYLIVLSRPLYAESPSFKLNFDNIDFTLILLIVFSIYNYIVIIFKILGSCQPALGLFLFESFNDEVKLVKANLNQLPLISFRVVTRGDYPQLIRKNLKINQDACKEAGLKNYIVEIVTEKPLSLPSDPKVKVILVPKNYATKNGTLFKARNLQYCLEKDVSILKDNDWIVHLDEDSMVTVDAVRGIANFIHEGQHQIGQGAITYDPFNETSYLTKLLMGFRMAFDFGGMRFMCKVQNDSKFAMKGSFAAVKVQAEKNVSFDGGLTSSVTEFSYFSLKAGQMGYTTGWIDGVTREIGALNVNEVMVQVRRGFFGLRLLSLCQDMNKTSKKKLFPVLYGFMLLGFPYVPLLIFNMMTSYGCPLYPSVARHLIGLSVALDLHIGIFAILKTDHLSFIASLWLFVLNFILGFYFPVIVNNIALARSLFQKDVKFEVTKKEI